MLFSKDVFQDKGVRTALGRYVTVVEKKEKARYLSADLDSKIKEAEKIIENCVFCERRCGVNRREKPGWCGIGYKSHVDAAFAHHGEEPELVPSGTIFFNGCNLCCVYCQNWSISQCASGGTVWSPERIAEWIMNCGCININFVGGEPTPNLHIILKALGLCDKNIPIIWNSNMYMSEEAMRLLKGVVDVYLGDFKYGNSSCGERLSNVPRYFETVTRNFRLAKDQAEILIRMLVLPGHTQCCTKPILDWINENLGNEVRTNIMSQYRPEYLALQKPEEYQEIALPLRRDEYAHAVDYAREIGLWNIETQSRTYL